MIDVADQVEQMKAFLVGIGCRHSSNWYILDEFSLDYYLAFDTSVSEDGEWPDYTFDIYVCRIGSNPRESENRLRLVEDCHWRSAVTLLCCLHPELKKRVTDYVFKSNGGEKALKSHGLPIK